jgi:hypothetical protein
MTENRQPAAEGEPEQPTPVRIMQLINGYWNTGILGAAATHRLFTHLDGGAGTVAALAQRSGVPERGVQTLLDGLLSLGLVELRPDGTYANTPEAAAYLVEGRPAGLASFAKLKLDQLPVMAGLPDVVQAGGPVAGPAVEVADNPHWGEVVQAIAAQSVPVAKLAAETLGLADAGEVSILDVGGGSGIYSAIWLGLNPKARATQLDWGPVNAIAQRAVEERGVADRFTSIDGDFHTTDFGEAAYDIAVYSHIAHQEGPEENVELFGKLLGALKPGGTLVVCDYVVEDDRSGPPFALLFATEMLLKSDRGGTWRRSDYRSWLLKAGFEKVEFQSTGSPATLAFGKRPEQHGAE